MEPIEIDHMDKLNEYLKKVLELDKVSYRRKVFELGRVADAARKHEKFTPIEEMTLREVIRYLKNIDTVDDILEEFEKKELIKFLSYHYFVAENPGEAARLLIDSGDLDIPFQFDGNMLPDSRRQDCMELIRDIVNKEGWNYLYNLVESQKNELHLI